MRAHSRCGARGVYRRGFCRSHWLQVGAIGCKGYRIAGADELGPILPEALQQTLPVLMDIPIDYCQNLKLMQDVHKDFIH